MTVRSGEFVVEHLTKNRTGEPIDDDQIQPNGVDLIVGDLLWSARNRSATESRGGWA